MAELERLAATFLRLLYSMAIGWLIELLRLIRQQCRSRAARRRLRDKGELYTDCQVIPPDVYKRPDPLIYCQSELLAQGLGVTWDNPDIQLVDVGAGMTAVDSHALEADTEYEIRATVYNGSTEAPAVGMPVEFSYLSFGIGTTSTSIGGTVIDLPVRGAPGHPALATVRWRTPAAPGHYCVQVKLVWPDDANPNNNLGQENTDVGEARSPATFQFPVGNQGTGPESLRLVADSYTLAEPVYCDEVPTTTQTPARGGQFTRGPGAADRGGGAGDPDAAGREAARQAQCAALLRRHALDGFDVPAEWAVQIDPSQLDLAAGEERPVTVTVDPPPGFAGSQAINVNALDANGGLVGGVTLYVTR